jgi:AbrB family looped-hinge helix DNA binding protein
MVRSKAKITSKGQLTLPAAVRKTLGVGPGDTLTFEVTEDEIRVVREREPGVFGKWAGRYRVGKGQSAAEIDRSIRELRGRE